jgi:uridine kinase
MRYQIDDLKKLTEQDIASVEEKIKKRLVAAADLIIGGGYKVILIAGGSASCKTSSTLAIDAILESHGLCSTELSMDDFYKNRDECPILPDGTYDIESLASIDVDLMNEVIYDLSVGKTANIPIFDFITARRTNSIKSVTPRADGVIMLEGINALNPAVAASVESGRVLRIFVEPQAEIYNGTERLMNLRDIRFLRRTVRDYYYRGASAEKTINMWDSVLRGEDQNVTPYVGGADVCIDTFFDYELSIFKECAEKIIPQDDAVHSKMLKSIRNMLKEIPKIDKQVVPKDSLLQEFIKI